MTNKYRIVIANLSLERSVSDAMLKSQIFQYFNFLFAPFVTPNVKFLYKMFEMF